MTDERERMAALDYADVLRIHTASPSEAFAEELERRDVGFEGAVLESLRGLDDAQLFHARKYPRIRALVDAEIAVRAHRERHQTEPWSSGPWSPVPPPTPEYQHLIEGVGRSQKRSWGQQRSRKEVRRGEHQKLLQQSRSKNKVEREAAEYILRTCYQSRS